jgi:hypothetical protein
MLPVFRAHLDAQCVGHSPSRLALLRLAPLGLVALMMAACATKDPTGLSAAPGRTFSVTVGQTLALRLQNVGPGQYVDPPQLSTAAVRFVSVSQVGPSVPAGITQLFRFQGVTAGRAIVSFQSSGTSGAIVDTIDVN